MACIYLNFIFEFVVIRDLALCAHTGPKLDDSQIFITFLGPGQLTVKGSSNRILPRFQEPFLGKARLG